MQEESRARAPPPAHLLSEDVVANIYRHLPTRHDKACFSLVCKRWLKAVCHARKTCHVWSPAVLPAVLRQSPQLTSIDCSGAFHIGDDHVTALAERYSGTLTELDLTNNRQVTDAGLKALGKRCAQLINLNLRNGSCTDLGIMGIAACSQLQVLKLINCRKLTDVGISCLGARCKSLTKLSLHFCMGLTDEAIHILMLNCPLLTSLDLAYTQVTTGAMTSLAQGPSLKSLSLAGCKKVDDSSLVVLSQGCKSLEVLDVSGCSAVSNAGIQALANQHVPLQQLLAAMCPQISDAVAPHLAQFERLSVLRLDLNAFSDAGLLALSQAYACATEASEASPERRCPLVELSVPKCSDIGNTGLLSVLPLWPNLLHLNLTCCKTITDTLLLSLAQCTKGLLSLQVEGCSSLKPDGLKALAQGCPRLHTLDITDCDVVEEGLLAVTQCRELRSLKLGFCAAVTDRALECLGGACGSLENLDLYRCQGFGKEGLGALGRGCPRLRELNISYCLDGWTDESMEHFCKHASSLRNLEMRGCRRVTSRGLSALASGCISLEELDLKKCTGIGEAGLLAIASQCTLLRQISLSYCPVSDAALRGLARMSCMVKFNLIHCSQVSVQGLCDALLSCAGLRKVKLLPEWKMKMPAEPLLELEARGCAFRWMAKPPDRDNEESGVVTQE